MRAVSTRATLGFAAMRQAIARQQVLNRRIEDTQAHSRAFS